MGKRCPVANLMHMRSVVVAALALATLLWLIAPTHAHDHVGPRAVLVSSEASQPGRSYHSDWIRATRDGRACVLSGGSGILRVPKAVAHEAREAVIVRLHKPALPREVEVRRWPRVDEQGMVTGDPTPVPFSLKPHVVDGTTRAWDVVVAPRLQAEHIYLDVAGYWADENGCSQEPDLGSQYKAWLFHLRTIS